MLYGLITVQLNFKVDKIHACMMAYVAKVDSYICTYFYTGTHIYLLINRYAQGLPRKDIMGE